MHDTSLPGAQRVVNVDVNFWQYMPEGLPIRQVRAPAVLQSCSCTMQRNMQNETHYI